MSTVIRSSISTEPTKAGELPCMEWWSRWPKRRTTLQRLLLVVVLLAMWYARFRAGL